MRRSESVIRANDTVTRIAYCEVNTSHENRSVALGSSSGPKRDSSCCGEKRCQTADRNESLGARGTVQSNGSSAGLMNPPSEQNPNAC